MSFSVAKRRPFRSLGLYRSSGKHAARRGSAHWPSRAAAGEESYRPAHAASMPGQAEPARDKAADPEAAASEQGAALQPAGA